MRTIVVLSVYMVSFFPNPFSRFWKRHFVHHTYSIGDITIAPAVEQPPYSDDRCFGDDSAIYIIEPDDSIGVGRTCADAMENGQHINPAIRWPNTHYSPQHKI